MSTPLHVYTTPPGMEHKALSECRDAIVKAALPRSKLRKPAFGRVSKPLLAGYVYAERKPQGAEHMRKSLGSVSRAEVSKLWTHARIRPAKRLENPYKPGDAVVITKGAFADIKASVLETRGRMCLIAHEMMRKVHTQAISYTQLRPG